MHKILTLVAVLLPAPVMAAELWCMPKKICRADKCHKNTDEEVSVRISDPDGANPMMRAFAEDVPMVKTAQGSHVQYTGTNDFQVTMVLDMNPANMRYKMTSMLDGSDPQIFIGKCEVQ